MKKQLGAVFLAAALLLGACSGAQSFKETIEKEGNKAVTKTASSDTSAASEEENPIKIIATFYPIYEYTREIVGDEATVNLLIPAGTEVHGYEPSTKDIAEIQDADVLVYEDPNMETWVPSALERIQKDSADVIQATEGLVLLPGGEHDDHDAKAEDHGRGTEKREDALETIEQDLGEDAKKRGHEEHHHEFDPHLWLSPARAILLVEKIRDGLIEKYPEKKDVFEKNAAAYLEKLSALDQSYQDGFATAKRRSFVTQHAAFAYLALDYGLRQISITGLSADTEPTLSRLEELSEYIHKYDIHYIYFEENAKASVAEALGKETGAELLVLNPLESLTEEQMDNGETYLSVMQENLEALRKTTEEAGDEILPEGADSEKVLPVNR